MKTTIKLFSLVFFAMILNACGSTSSSSLSNMVAIMEVTEPIEGVCNQDKVYAILPFGENGQVSAVSPKTNAEIEVLLNNILYLPENKDYSGEGMVSMVINCKGEMVRCKIDKESGVEELDIQIVEVFETLKTWTAATINGESVDSIELVSYSIKEGSVTIN